MTGRATFQDLTTQLAPDEETAARHTFAAEDGLHVCVGCGSKLVYPTQCERYTDASYRVALRCPDCDRFRVGVFERSRVDDLDQELERGGSELEADLARLANSNMAGYVDRFVHALRADAIYPLDF